MAQERIFQAVPGTNYHAARRPTVLVAGKYPEEELSILAEDYQVLRLWEAVDRDLMLAQHGEEVRALIVRSDMAVGADIVQALPHLEIIACFGAGTDAIDLAMARHNNIKVTNTPDIASGDVADAAIALCLAVARRVLASDAHVRQGTWQLAAFPLTSRFFGKRMGIVGLGRIGLAIAKRAAAFDMEIAYHNRSPRSDVSFPYFAGLEELAGRSDFLVASLSGGEESQGLIGAHVLAALGRRGFFINVARGSVVDEPALLHALEKKIIAGAGLDVFCGEPAIDARFLKLKNVVLQPHSASATQETRAAMGQLVRDNLARHFSGKPLLTPV